MINYENHELFRRVYGDFEYERLKPIFETEPEELTTGATWEVPPIAEAEYKIRLLCLAGVGSMSFLARLLSSRQICDQIKAFIFVENDPKVISHLVNHPHFKPFVSHESIRFCFQMSEEMIKPAFFRILKNPNYSEIMELGCVYWNKTEADPVLKAFYEGVDKKLKESVNHVYTNYGEINDSVQGIRATFLNGERIVNCPGILDLKNAYEGKTALVIGAGPSLDEEISLLKEHHQKFVIFAADAAVKPLVAAGIYPHYCTSIERLNSFQKPFWEGLDPKDCELVCYPVLHPEVIDLYKGDIRVVYRNYSYYAYFEKNWPKGVLHCGSSTSNLAVRLAHYMGCKEIILIGIDHAYVKREDGLYKSHCENIGQPLWKEWHPISYFEGEPRKHAPAFEVEGYDGSDVMTNYTYYLWSKEFSEEVLNLSIPIRATCRKGVKMVNIPFESFESVVSRVEPGKVAKVEPKPATLFKQWHHETLTESVEGWIRTAKHLLTVLSGEIDQQLLQYVSEIYNLRFVKEDLFVSFIIQNCAGDYYRLQNEHNGLDFSPEAYELKKHQDLFRRRFELFLNVLEKVDLILKETLGNGTK
jgi:hypothetical protein